MPALSKLAVLSGPVDFCCLVCEAIFRDLEEAFGHVETKQHIDNFLASSYVEKYAAEHIRKVKQYLYCEACNVIISSSRKIQNHIAEDTHEFNNTTEESADASNVFVRHGNEVIAFNDILIEENAWNGIIDESCIICDVDWDDLKSHLNDVKHVINLIQAKIHSGFGHTLFRKVDNSQFHCLSCNAILPQEQFISHWDSTDHVKCHLKCRKSKRALEESKVNNKNGKDSEIERKQDTENTKQTNEKQERNEPSVKDISEIKEKNKPSISEIKEEVSNESNEKNNFQEQANKPEETLEKANLISENETPDTKNKERSPIKEKTDIDANEAKKTHDQTKVSKHTEHKSEIQEDGDKHEHLDAKDCPIIENSSNDISSNSNANKTEQNQIIASSPITATVDNISTNNNLALNLSKSNVPVLPTNMCEIITSQKPDEQPKITIKRKLTNLQELMYNDLNEELNINSYMFDSENDSALCVLCNWQFNKHHYQAHLNSEHHIILENLNKSDIASINEKIVMKAYKTSPQANVSKEEEMILLSYLMDKTQTSKTIFDLNWYEVWCNKCEKKLTVKRSFILSHINECYKEEQASNQKEDQTTKDKESMTEEVAPEKTGNEIESHQKKPEDKLVKFYRENHISIYGRYAMCHACDAEMSYVKKCVNEHINGARHKRNSENYVRSDESESSGESSDDSEDFVFTKTPMEDYVTYWKPVGDDCLINNNIWLSLQSYCLIHNGECLCCEVRVGDSAQEFDAHVNSDKHRKNMAHIQVLTSLNSEFVRVLKSDKYHCGLCPTILSGSKELRSHLRGASEHMGRKMASHMCAAVNKDEQLTQEMLHFIKRINLNAHRSYFS